MTIQQEGLKPEAQCKEGIGVLQSELAPLGLVPLHRVLWANKAEAVTGDLHGLRVRFIPTALCLALNSHPLTSHF